MLLLLVLIVVAGRLRHVHLFRHALLQLRHDRRDCLLHVIVLLQGLVLRDPPFQLVLRLVQLLLRLRQLSFELADLVHLGGLRNCFVRGAISSILP